MLNKEEYVLTNLKKILAQKFAEKKYTSYSPADVLVLIATLEVAATLGEDALEQEEEEI